MVTVNREIALYHTGEFHHIHLKNRDGTSVRCRTNGVCKTWKTRPGDFRLPVKYGLRECFYIQPHNAMDWEITDDAYEEVRRKALCARLGLDFNTPEGIVADYMAEHGL